MNKIKATVRNGRTTKSGQVFNANHNTRTETRNLEGHINHERTALNVNFKFFADGNIEKCDSFDSKEFELSQYEIYFGDGLKAKNERYVKEGHAERCKTIAEVYQNPKTAPLETILQLGNVKSDIHAEERKRILTASAFELIDELRRKYGKNLKILSFSVHLDEQVIHGHLRSCVLGEDKFGYSVPNQSLAFAEMGIERPDLNEKRSRYNNPLITFSNELRNRFYDLCEQKGVIIDREVKSPSQKHKEILEYKCDQLEKSVADLTAERDTLRDQNSITQMIKDSFSEPDRNIEAEIIPPKTSKGQIIEPEKVKISKADYEWLRERSRMTMGIQRAFENLQQHGRQLWERMKRDKAIEDLSQRLETAEKLNRDRDATVKQLIENLDRAYEQLDEQNAFMQKIGVWQRFCDFVKQKFRERQERERSDRTR